MTHSDIPPYHAKLWDGRIVALSATMQRILCEMANQQAGPSNAPMSGPDKDPSCQAAMRHFQHIAKNFPNTMKRLTDNP